MTADIEAGKSVDTDQMDVQLVTSINELTTAIGTLRFMALSTKQIASDDQTPLVIKELVTLFRFLYRTKVVRDWYIYHDKNKAHLHFWYYVFRRAADLMAGFSKSTGSILRTH